MAGQPKPNLVLSVTIERIPLADGGSEPATASAAARSERQET